MNKTPVFKEFVVEFALTNGCFYEFELVARTEKAAKIEGEKKLKTRVGYLPNIQETRVNS